MLGHKQPPRHLLRDMKPLFTRYVRWSIRSATAVRLFTLVRGREVHRNSSNLHSPKFPFTRFGRRGYRAGNPCVQVMSTLPLPQVGWATLHSYAQERSF